MDQSGNDIEITRKNAVAEGVGDRVELRTADMTDVPIESGSVDVVTSNLSIHNVKTAVRRDRVIDEAARVLRPGGRMLIADLGSTKQYRRRLVALGMIDVERRGLGWRMGWSGPWLATHLVTATVPPPEQSQPPE